MEHFISVSGVAAPMMQINIDTDQIIPTIYLGGTDAKGYGAHLFANWRFLPDGEPNPDFILNREPFTHAEVLLAGRNFGCGSSRERAPKALREFGFRAVIAPSFGGIFFNNCFRNGLLPVVLPIEQVQQLVDAVERGDKPKQITVDLRSNTVLLDADTRFTFEVPETLRQMLLMGIDEIDQTLSHRSDIDAFRVRDRLRRSWAYIDPPVQTGIPNSSESAATR